MARPRRILVVDDDVDIREILSDMLADAGYEVVHADDGSTALKLLRGKGPRPDAILLDMMMPTMDGATFRTLQLADEALAKIPVVAISAFGKPRLPGVREAFAKPLDFAQIRAAIQRLLTPSSPPPSSATA